MAKTAVTELQQQIEVVRREAFAAGYRAAMQAIRELASRLAADTGVTTSRRRGAAGRKTSTAPRTTATPRRRAPARRKTSSTAPRTTATPRRRRPGRAGEGAAKTRRSTARRPQRGANAQLIDELLQASAPRALRPAEIRKALHDKGIEISFTSLRHALDQLAARSAAEQVRDSKTWRHRGAAS